MTPSDASPACRETCAIAALLKALNSGAAVKATRRGSARIKNGVLLGVDVALPKVKRTKKPNDHEHNEQIQRPGANP